jgi:hypothetical protein
MVDAEVKAFPSDGRTDTSGADEAGPEGGRQPDDPSNRHEDCTDGSIVITKNADDPLGDKVIKVHIRTERFVIYTVACEADQVRRPRYFFPGKYAAAETFRERLNPISASLNRINDMIVGMRPDGLALPFYRRQYRSLGERSLEHQARAMQQAFEGNATDAEVVLSEFQAEVENCRDSRNKMRYILANAVALILILIAWLILSDANESAGQIAALMTASFDAKHADIRLIDMLTLGAIGAFFAVSIGINALRISHSITIPEMFYAGFIRIMIGVIAAGVLLLLILGGWVLASIDPDYRFWSIYLLGFLAGFSELLVPNALKRVEETTAVNSPPPPTNAAAAEAR